MWAVVSDPRTHSDWWPDVLAVEAPDGLAEGDEYTRTSRMPFRDAVDAVWVAERLEQLKEARFRCTMTGSYAHFLLTPAQDGTFVELRTGMDPANIRWRLMKAISGSYWKRWTFDALDALPEAVARASAASRDEPQPVRGG